MFTRLCMCSMLMCTHFNIGVSKVEAAPKSYQSSCVPRPTQINSDTLRYHGDKWARTTHAVVYLELLFHAFFRPQTQFFQAKMGYNQQTHKGTHVYVYISKWIISMNCWKPLVLDVTTIISTEFANIKCNSKVCTPQKFVHRKFVHSESPQFVHRKFVHRESLQKFVHRKSVHRKNLYRYSNQPK